MLLSILMQDRFVGDIGDFGKYGLLRALTGIWPPLPPEERLSLGVVWYVPDEQTIHRTPKGHGQNTGYINNPDQFRDCDPELFDFLKEIVCNDRRKLKEVEQGDILGNSVFYDKNTPQDISLRKKWVNCAIDHTKGRNIIFLDPNIGISPQRKEGKSSEHIYLNDVRSFLKAGRRQTIIAYQQYAYSQKGRDNQVQQWITATRRFSRNPRVLSTSQRAFIILPTSDHVERIDERLGELAQRWSRHFIQLAL